MSPHERTTGTPFVRYAKPRTPAATRKETPLMSQKKKMTPAQKAAARWDAYTPAPDEPTEAAAHPTDQTPPYLTVKNVLIAIAGIALVAAFSYFSMGNMA